LNAILSEARAIVSDVAGTTRDSIEAWADICGWPVKLVDTAGIRKGGENFGEIEAEGVRRSEELAKKADIVIAFGDFAESCGIGLEESKVIRITPKCDLRRGDSLNVSALTHEGVEELKLEVASRLQSLAESADEADRGEGERYLSALVRARGILAEVDFNLCDAVLAGNEVRRASQILGETVGADYSDDLLTSLFSRFCVGK
jgi:tRNA modification GTPase